MIAYERAVNLNPEAMAVWCNLAALLLETKGFNEVYSNGSNLCSCFLHVFSCSVSGWAGKPWMWVNHRELTLPQRATANNWKRQRGLWKKPTSGLRHCRHGWVMIIITCQCQYDVHNFDICQTPLNHTFHHINISAWLQGWHDGLGQGPEA